LLGALAGTSITSLLDQLIALILDLMKTLFTLSDLDCCSSIPFLVFLSFAEACMHH